MIWLGFVNQLAHRIARAQAIRVVLSENMNHIPQLFGVGQAIALVYPAIDSETVKYTHIINTNLIFIIITICILKYISNFFASEVVKICFIICCCLKIFLNECISNMWSNHKFNKAGE